jgi:hypothetical protein
MECLCTLQNDDNRTESNVYFPFNGNAAPARTVTSGAKPGRFCTSLATPSAFIVASLSEHGIDADSAGHTMARTKTSCALLHPCGSTIFCENSRSCIGKRAFDTGIFAPANTESGVEMSRTVMTIVSSGAGLDCGSSRYKRAVTI